MKTKTTIHGITTNRLPELKKGKYSDGHPLDTVQYLECKIILKGDRFTAESKFDDFARIVKQAAQNSDVDFSRKGFKDVTPQIREVLFLDTADFRLYNHAFILRRRVIYEHGFAVSDPEIVFKFRHPDMQTAADVDLCGRAFSATPGSSSSSRRCPSKTRSAVTGCCSRTTSSFRSARCMNLSKARRQPSCGCCRRCRSSNSHRRSRLPW